MEVFTQIRCDRQLLYFSSMTCFVSFEFVTLHITTLFSASTRCCLHFVLFQYRLLTPSPLAQWEVLPAHLRCVTVFSIVHHFSYLFFLAHTSKCVYCHFSYLFFLAHTSKCVYYHFSYLFFLARTSKCVYYRFSYLFFLARTSKCVYYRFSYLFFLAHTSKCVYYRFSYLFFLARTSKCVYYCFNYLFFLAHTSRCVYYCLFIRHENVLFTICLRKKCFFCFFLLSRLENGLNFISGCASSKSGMKDRLSHSHWSQSSLCVNTLESIKKRKEKRPPTKKIKKKKSLLHILPISI